MRPVYRLLDDGSTEGPFTDAEAADMIAEEIEAAYRDGRFGGVFPDRRCEGAEIPVRIRITLSEEGA